MKQRILLIDFSSLAHAVKFSLAKQRLSNNDKPTFVIYGFLLKLQYMMKKIRPNTVVIATDSKESHRKKIESTYKEKRHKEKAKEQIELDNLAYPQFDALINYVLPTIGYRNIFGAEGFEADDILARICKSYPDCEIVMVTDDKDMYQCLTDMVCIFIPKTNKYFSIKDFRKKYDIEPKMWKRVKAIGGCTSDEIKGVPIPQPDPKKKQMHVAETGALNYIKGTTNPATQAHQAIISRAGKDRINRNKSLVILPFKGTPEYRILPDRPSKKGFLEVCNKYGFKSLIADIDNFKQPLRLF